MFSDLKARLDHGRLTVNSIGGWSLTLILEDLHPELPCYHHLRYTDSSWLPWADLAFSRSKLVLVIVFRMYSLLLKPRYHYICQGYLGPTDLQSEQHVIKDNNLIIDDVFVVDYNFNCSGNISRFSYTEIFGTHGPSSQNCVQLKFIKLFSENNFSGKLVQ